MTIISILKIKSWLLFCPSLSKLIVQRCCIKPQFTIANFAMYVFMVFTITFLSWNTGHTHTHTLRTMQYNKKRGKSLTSPSYGISEAVRAHLGCSVPQAVHSYTRTIMCVRHIHHRFPYRLDHFLQCRFNTDLYKFWTVHYIQTVWI